MARVPNPILSGCHPDPSIVTVDGVHYLVNSTFEYFPGLPIHRSTDLVNWELVGHALHREDQLDLSTAPSSGGLFAPTLRHDGSRFWLVCTAVHGDGPTGNFVMTAVDPAGPWSDPVWVDAEGIDPSLLFDADGRAWWCGTRLTDPVGRPDRTDVWVREFDVEQQRLVGPEFLVWHGAVEGAIWAEGPHLYRRGDGYLLLASEGGTAREHALSAARADAPTGPFSGFPQNPLLTHRTLGDDAPIVNVGHADLTEDADGRTWAVLLATRTVDGADSLLGRETFLVDVGFERGRPLFAPGRARVEPTIEVPGAAPDAARTTDFHDDFTGDALHGEFTLVRTAASPRWSLTARPGRLRLTPTSGSLSEVAPHAFVGRRLRDLACRVTTRLELPAGARGGLALRQSEAAWFALEADADAGRLAALLGGTTEATELGAIPLERPDRDGPVVLDLAVEVDGFRAVAAVDAGDGWRELASADLSTLSTSVTWGFLGTWAGMYALGSTDVDFDHFSYIARTPAGVPEEPE